MISVQVAEPLTAEDVHGVRGGRPNSGFESRDRGLLPPPGALLSRVEAMRTPESVARQVRLYGVDAVRYMQSRGWA